MEEGLDVFVWRVVIRLHRQMVRVLFLHQLNEEWLQHRGDGSLVLDGPMLHHRLQNAAAIVLEDELPVFLVGKEIHTLLHNF